MTLEGPLEARGLPHERASGLSPMKQQRPHRPGIAFALASAVLFGASVPAAKQLLGSVDPWLLAGLLYVGSGAGLSLFLVIRHLILRRAPEAFIASENLIWLVGAVLFGGVLGPVFLMLGLTYTPASTASLLLNLESLATMTIA
jgi:drug/metabolite transporter (DMT)-like permease